MRYHYDVTGAEVILRDIPVYGAAALPYGALMASGPVATTVNNSRSILADPAVMSNVIGVLNEDVSAADALAVVLTGVENYAKHIINPGAVYLADYAAAATVTTNGADVTGKTLTSADSGVANQVGCWCYVKTGDGIGNLFMTGAVTGTTVMTAVTDYDDNLAGNASGDTYITTHLRYGSTVVGGDIDLDATLTLVNGVVAAGATGAAICLENYITSQVRPLEPLVIATHSGTNYAAEEAKGLQLSADLWFPEHLLATGGAVNDRVIT